MKIKTKSGFVCDVNTKAIRDWRFVKLLAKSDSKDESAQLEGTTQAVSFLLGEEGENKLMQHITDDEGFVDSGKLIAEFKEILKTVGKEIKKSQPSPE